MQRKALFPLLMTLLLAVPAWSDERGSFSELSATIDRLIDARHHAQSISPTELIDDYGFARRVTLDVAGRVPTLQELVAFVETKSPYKRREYVDRLLASPDYAFHLRNSLDNMLLAEHKTDEAWRDYLLEAARENRPWDRIFCEILVPERERPEDKRPAAFLHARAKDLDAMTNDASVLLFGVNIACAKCHDHPLVDDWQQRHYYGLASFFQRTFATRTGFVSENFDGQLKFTTTAGDENQAELMFLTGVTVQEPEHEFDKDFIKSVRNKIRDAQRKDDAEPPPKPEFSPRAELARLALEPGSQNLLARNIVNRLWAWLIGRGLVHPLDQMHTENTPSHPQLLTTLADDFVAHGYDLKRLVRSIVLSRTYARRSGWAGASDPHPQELFARGITRPLTPRQLAISLRIATHKPESVRDLNSGQQRQQLREQLEQQSTKTAARLAIPQDGFQVGTEEALEFSNSPQFHDEFLASGENQLVDYLSESDDERLIETLFLSIVSRRPTGTERGAVSLHLAQRSDNRVEAIRQVAWALLASPEFRFNH